MTQAPTLIFGRGGHSLEVIHVALSNGILQDSSSIFTVVNDGGSDDRNLLPYETLTESQAADSFGAREVRAIVPIGSSKVRRDVVGRILRTYPNATFPNVIDQTAILTPQAVIPEASGIVILQRAMVSNRARLGAHVHLNVGALVGHECIVQDFSTVGPHVVLCGASQMGEASTIGANSTINDRIKVGSGVFIGSGSVVIHDITGPGAFAGNPVKPLAPRQ